MKDSKIKEDTLQHIARELLNLDTLRVRHSDSLDFSNQAVWNINTALRAAYAAGAREATKEVRNCKSPTFGCRDGFDELFAEFKPDAEEMVLLGVAVNTALEMAAEIIEGKR